MRKVTTPVPVEGGVLDVQRNGSPIGTITFGIGASAGTFATADGGAETFTAGEPPRDHQRQPGGSLGFLDAPCAALNAGRRLVTFP